jgi:hypothetical protein
MKKKVPRTTKTTKLVWKKRPASRDTAVSRIWRWTSENGLYAVERHRFTQKCKTYPDAWFALKRGEKLPGVRLASWNVMGGSRFPSRKKAEYLCQLDYNCVMARRATKKG